MAVELLVPLTWPIEKTDLQMTVNHHRHTPYLQLAQVNYKRGILDSDLYDTLRTVVRIALPSMAETIEDRSTRDEGIIRLVLYFLRNITMINPPPNLHYDGNEDEVSRSATIEAFKRQEIFHLFLTLASGMGEDFNTQDVVLMEVLFHLIKGIDVQKLFKTEAEVLESQSDELRELMKKEAAMNRDYLRHAPSRHNRFGTMIWIKRDNAKMSTVSGQDALMSNQRGLAKIDETKKWKKPRRHVKQPDLKQNEFDSIVDLTPSAVKGLRAFVEEFLDSGFNPLFSHIRRAIEREAERVLGMHRRQYFFLVAWFLGAERARRKAHKAYLKKVGKSEVEADSFALVASVLNQETFIALQRFMVESYDSKEWQDLNAAMRCFTQILLMVREMSESPLEDDQEIAENIQNRIFYEEATHDQIVLIVRYYKIQGFGYLDACTELAHVHLSMLERYSKQNVDLQIRSRRRTRRKKKATQQQDNVDDSDQDSGSEAEDIAQAHRMSSERKFDFTRFVAKFMTQNCVDTFVAFTKYYAELNPEQLKRAHRFFYRVAFKMDLNVMLYRIDIIALFHKMVKGPGGLDPLNPIYKEWDDLTRHLFKHMTRKLEKRPELFIEMLFSKMGPTVHYLQHGFEKLVYTAAPRPAADLEVKPGMDLKEQIGVVTSILIDQNKTDEIEWLKKVLESAIDERQSWESMHEATQAAPPSPKALPSNPETSSVAPLQPPATNAEIPKPPIITIRPPSDALRIATFKDARLRLLMKLLSLHPPEPRDNPHLPWTIPSALSPTDLTTSLTHLNSAQFAPPVFDADQSATDFLRSVPAKRNPHAAFDDDDDDDEGSASDSAANNELDPLFPPGGPTPRPRSAALTALKASRGNKVRQELTDEAAAARARKRRENERERNRKIKSAVLVGDSESDSEADREFFRLEEERRRSYARKVGTMIGAGRKRKGAEGEGRGKKRRVGKVPDGDASMDEQAEFGAEKDSSSSLEERSASEGEAEDEDTETPLSSPHAGLAQGAERSGEESRGGRKGGVAHEGAALGKDVVIPDADADADADEDEDELVRTIRRPRTKAGFLVDSNDE